MDKTSTSSWFRGFDIIVGLILIVSSIIMFFSTGSLAVIIGILTFSVLLLGISKLISGSITTEMMSSYRWVNIVSGVILILLSLYIYFLPPVAASTTVVILMVGLLLYGVDSLVVGFVKGLSGNIRLLLIVAGILSVIASLMGFIDPTLASIAAVSAVTLALLADGIEEMTAGVTGHTAF
jgi:uncharacterized membrane protein HdeD (DUF308 family)